MAGQKPISVPQYPNSHALFWLTFSLSLVILPHIVRLPTWASVVAAISIAYALLSFNYHKARPGVWILWPLLLTCMLGITAHYGEFFGRDAGIALLVIALTLKLQEIRSHRDGMVLIGLIYFTVITHFLYEQNIPLALFMLAAVTTNTFALITLNTPESTMRFIEKMRMVTILVSSALPIMVVLFILFPRIPGPLWGLPQDDRVARTGLDDQMTLGEFSRAALSYDAAFRVVFTDKPPPAEKMYWRTMIFWDYDGRSWQTDKALTTKPESLEPTGNGIGYSITIEPHHKKWLVILDMPIKESVRAMDKQKLELTSERLLRSEKPVSALSRYSAVSYPQYRLGRELQQEERRRALKIPENLNPRSLELARSWRERAKQPQDLINFALALFAQDFTYSLRPPPLGPHSIDDFLFKTQKGFCEHFSASFVLLMRAAGIPARVVAGYQGGEFNPIGNYFLIRQSDAHAWAEVWLENYGWTRIDPTGIVSPERIELGFDAAIPAAEKLGFFLHRNSFMAGLNLFLDSINNRWNEWILGYGPETQMLFLKLLGFKKPNVFSMTLSLLSGMAAILTILVFFHLYRRPFKSNDPVQRSYLEFCKKLAKAGYCRLPHEGPEDFSARISKQTPDLENILNPIFRLYAELRYGRPRENKDAIRHFNNGIKKISVSNVAKIKPRQGY